MRLRIAASILCLAGLCAPALLAATDEPPKAEAGLLGDHHGGAGQRHDQDQGLRRRRRQHRRPGEGDCTEPKLTPLNEGIIVDVTCTSKQGKQTISTTFTGDFQTRYHATLKTTFDPPIGAISHMGVNIDGKYLGPDCPADAAPEKQ